jgi:prolyl-tRNA editing enzyme YbaK/EbsC (Cys-tRNA(Pro) deacylase)
MKGGRVMAMNERLKRYLDQEHAPYETLPHREAFTARQVAIESRVPERQLAKVLALEEEGNGHLMAVLPAACRLDLNALRHAAGRHRLSRCGKTRCDASSPTASWRCCPVRAPLRDAGVRRRVLVAGAGDRLSGRQPP